MKKYHKPKGSSVPVIVINLETYTTKIVLKKAEQNFPLIPYDINPNKAVNPSTSAPQTFAATFSPSEMSIEQTFGTSD